MTPDRRIRPTLVEGRELVAVVGESHYQDALRAITGSDGRGVVRHECEAALVPEPDNPHDPNAVMVRIDGRLVGYLSRADAVAYAPLVAGIAARGRTAVAEAMVAGRGEESGTSNLGVFLRMPAPE